MSHAEHGRPERTRGREAALQLLYRAEIGGLDVDAAFREYWEEAADYLDGDAEHLVREFASALFHGVRDRAAELDELIAASLQNWRIERVAVIDRIILRIAAFELVRGTDPAAVVIDESLELARRFGGDDSVRFINGVVDGVRTKIG
jgi:N utilization substance protein B